MAHPGMTHEDQVHALGEKTQHTEVSLALPSTLEPVSLKGIQKKKKHNKLMVTTLTVLTIHGGERWVYKAVSADWELMG